MSSNWRRPRRRQAAAGAAVAGAAAGRFRRELRRANVADLSFAELATEFEALNVDIEQTVQTYQTQYARRAEVALALQRRANPPDLGGGQRRSREERQEKAEEKKAEEKKAEEKKAEEKKAEEKKAEEKKAEEKKAEEKKLRFWTRLMICQVSTLTMRCQQLARLRSEHS
ncbi:hypothetical protein CFD26_108237 [Aspergillus turcosus]|uniref:Uncharacterized protein n=1 Tax=Aspergillus turcosus TaxID=1245748 RepID=A0A421DF80_9EURO|nr:hypothetical protein CFD26_108237 [Aspergillus turcosus]